VGGGLLLVAAGLPFSISYAEVTSSGLGTTVNQPAAGVFNITGGTRPNNGPNLFHSFGNFSLNTPESANFLNNSGLPTTNILSRVTGGNPSSIFGTINTLDFPAANLFLMNPAGIVFGPTAQLNVNGSFHATTADYIKLGNDGIFYANPAQPTVLSVAPPSAFGFLTTNPAPIEVQTGGIDFETFLPTALLQVPEGQTLSLVGGNAPGSDTPGVSIGALDASSPGYVLAPAGRVNLVSVASAGEAAFDGKGFNVDGFTQLGGVKVGPGSIVDGKEIFVRGGRFVIEDGVLLPGAFAFELSFVGLSPLPDGGEVNIKVTDDVTITGTDFEPLTFAPPGIFAYSGDALSISPEAKVPDVSIEAGSLSISGFAAIQTRRNAPGEPGNVVINANTVNVGSGGSVSLFNTFAGPGGNLIINAKDVTTPAIASMSPG
jgi:filamentous hemagglutinin family protein